MTADIAQRANSSEFLRRSFDITECEFRDDGPTGCTFEGVASVVDKPYSVRDKYGTFEETMRNGAFDKTLSEKPRKESGDVGLFTNHDYRVLPMATRRSGRLQLDASPDLHVVAHLNPARPSVQEARHAVTDGDASQMSIGFTVPKSRDKWSEDMTKREIYEVHLREVSIVWQGANPHTSASMRALDEFIEGLADVEMDEAQLLRAIAHLTAMLPTDPVVEEIINEFAERDRDDRERLERKRLLRI